MLGFISCRRFLAPISAMRFNIETLVVTPTNSSSLGVVSAFLCSGGCGAMVELPLHYFKQPAVLFHASQVRCWLEIVSVPIPEDLVI